MTEIIGKQPDFTRPVLFLDFDDVINVFSDSYLQDPSAFHQETVVIPKGTHRPNGEPIQSDRELHLVWHDEIVDELRNLNAVWISSWKQLTQTVLNPMLGFDFGYANWQYRGLYNPSHDGKRLAIEEIIDDNHIPAFVIADDSFFKDEEKMVIGVDGLIKSPSYGGEGLSLDDVKEIRKFLEAEHSVSFRKLHFQDLQDCKYSGRIYCVAYLNKEKVENNVDDPFFCFGTATEVHEYLKCKEESGIRDARDFSTVYQIAIAYIDLENGCRISDGIEGLI